MDPLKRGLSTLEILSETSRSIFLRCSDITPIPVSIYFDSNLPLSELPSSTRSRILCSLIHQVTEGTKIIDSAFQENQALKCFDSSGETIYLIFYSSEPTLNSFVLARYSFKELTLDPNFFYKELARLALDRVKDIRFKNSLKESLGCYSSYFSQWVETVNSQQAEINQLNTQLSLYKQTQEKTQEKEQNLTVGCVICEKEQRKIVFVPCGHILICAICLLQDLKLKPNTLATSSQKCITCKKPIKLAHEVYF